MMKLFYIYRVKLILYIMFIFLLPESSISQDKIITDNVQLHITADRPGALVYLNKEKKGIIGKEGSIIINIQEGSYHLFIEKPINESIFSYSASRDIIVRNYSSMSFNIKLIYGLNQNKKLHFEKDRQAIINKGISRLTMVNIPEGMFTMGSDSISIEQPIHKVNVPAFKISKNPVTFALFDLYVIDTDHHLPDDSGWGRNDRPVINVSWDDTQKFIKWLNKMSNSKVPFRLPTEIEWEYAARADTKTKYWWGDDLGSNNANCYACGSQWDNKKTAPVGSFNENPFGLNDMSGNVFNWIQDCWNVSYNGAPEDGLPWLEGNCQYHVLRGGSWFSNPKYLRPDKRHKSSYKHRHNEFGFRLAQDR